MGNIYFPNGHFVQKAVQKYLAIILFQALLLWTMQTLHPRMMILMLICIIYLTPKQKRKNQKNNAMRKRQKISSNAFVQIGLNESARKRKFSVINDKLNKMMNAKNEKKNGIKLLSIQQKRQMREDSDRREQERRYQIEQNRLENERLKRMEREKIQREENEKLNRLEPNDDECFDDFDSFMNDNNDNNDKAAKTTKQSEEILQIIGDKKEMLTKNQSSSSSDDESLVDMLIAPGLDKLDQTEKKEEIDPEVQKLIDLGIPIKLHSFKWLYTNCNQLTQQNREKIVAFMT